MSIRLALLLLALTALLGVGPCNPSAPCETDSDGDGVCELDDVCPGADDGVDADADGLPDACDACPTQPGADRDGDGKCDVADPCPLDRPNDADSNGVCDVVDRFPLDDVLTIDHVQVKGTHNSYHVEPPIPFSSSHRYTQPPLGEQLDTWGVRAFEIDVHQDTDGFRVYHLILVDQETTCYSLVDCLTDIRDWSDLHPHHLPIVVWFEIKDDAGGGRIDDLDPMDTLIRGVFGDPRILTPDDVRGSFTTLREAIDTVGWPSLGETRGQILFALIESGDIAEAYRDGAPSLEGRVMFTHAGSSNHDEPWAAVAKINNPASASDIASAHAAGILVASNTCNADESDATCFADVDAGIANGVHMLKDDFPAPVDSRDYYLQLPDATPARCNDVTAPVECTSEDLE